VFADISTIPVHILDVQQQTPEFTEKYQPTETTPQL
jgi:hypothetical protein